MKIARRNGFSLHGKMSLAFIGANLIVLMVNLSMLLGMNGMSAELDMVYEENLRLNELGSALDAVQSGMTAYLQTKTSDSLEEYYRSEQAYAQMVSELTDIVNGRSDQRMERNIRKLSEKYLDEVSQTIEAKRGRNVEKYRQGYENAVNLYQYINTHISSLNNEQFKINSQHYRELSETFRLFVTISMVVLSVMILGKMAVSMGQYISQLKERMEAEQDLREKELKMEAHLKDAQLKYLQAQINPHFLFNTLNAGAQLAMMEAADRTYAYVQNVAEFFRYNIRQGREIVTIREELELVENYIYILNVRFSGEIRFEKQVEEQLLDIAVPVMLIQPVVENCINHGIQGIDWPGEIFLGIYQQADRVCISVRDNGVGMSPEEIRMVLSGTVREESGGAGSNGVGMGNVISRLQLFTGREDVVTIASGGKDQGTEVTIYLPMWKGEAAQEEGTMYGGTYV